MTTNQASFNLVNSPTTVNFAQAATTLSIGATSGTATIRNVTLSLPNATSISAAAAAATLDSAAIGGGYGSTGVSISNAGNIQANGTLHSRWRISFDRQCDHQRGPGSERCHCADITSTTTTATVFNSRSDQSLSWQCRYHSCRWVPLPVPPL